MANETMLLTKVCEALKAVVSDSFAALLVADPDAITTTNLYMMKFPGEKGSPSVNFGAAKAKEDPVGSGNFWVEAEVAIHTPAAIDVDAVDPTAENDLLVANVFSALDVDNLAALMEAAVSNLTVFGFGEGRDFERLEHGDHWSEVWRRQIYCCGVTL